MLEAGLPNINCRLTQNQALPLLCLKTPVGSMQVRSAVPAGEYVSTQLAGFPPERLITQESGPEEPVPSLLGRPRYLFSRPVQ